MEDQKNNKNISEFEIDELIVKVYNNIASWHNDDGSSSGLKMISVDIINTISNSVFDHLGIPYNGDVKINKDLLKQAKNNIEK